MSQPTARHGQPIGILELFGSLAVGVLLLLLFRRVWTEILAHGDDRATEANVVQANDWLSQLAGNMELVLVLIAIFGLLVLAVFRSSFVQS